MGVESVTEGTATPAHIILDGGDIWVMVDAVAERYYIDALPDSSPRTLRLIFKKLTIYGFDLMEEDDGEYDPIELPSGHVRRYLVPTWD